MNKELIEERIGCLFLESKLEEIVVDVLNEEFVESFEDFVDELKSRIERDSIILLLKMSLTGDKMDTRVNILNDATKKLSKEQLERLDTLLSEVNDLLVSSIMATVIEDFKNVLPVDAEEALRIIEEKGKKRPPHLKVVKGQVSKDELNN